MVVLVVVGMALWRPWHKPWAALLVGPLNHLNLVCALIGWLADVAAGGMMVPHEVTNYKRWEWNIILLDCVCG